MMSHLENKDKALKEQKKSEAIEHAMMVAADGKSYLADMKLSESVANDSV